MYAVEIIVPNLIICYALLKLLDKVFEYKYSSRMYFGLYLSMTIYQCFAALLDLSFLPFITFLAMSLLVIRTCYKDAGNKIMYTVFVAVYLLSGYSLIKLLLTVLFHTLKGPAPEGKIDFFLTWILGGIIMFFSYYYILKPLSEKRVKALTEKQELFMVAVGVAEAGIGCLVSQSKAYDLSEMNLLISGACLAFLVIDLCLVLLFEHILDKNELEYQIKLNEKYLEQVELQNENYRKVMHDIKSHLRIMKEIKLADEEYCDEALQLINWNGTYFQCSDKVLNQILNDRLRLCENKEINVKLDIDDINLDFMRKSDITTIFMNLIDNAIEAADETTDRRIAITIRKIQGSIVVIVKNSCNEDVRISDKCGVTSKKGHMGIGLANVRRALSDYGSQLELTCENHIFVSRCIFMI